MEKREFRSNENGQLTIQGLLLMFLVLLTLAALIGDIITEVGIINAALTAAGFVEAAIMINFYPLFLMVIVLATLVMYGGPRTA